MTLYQRFCKLSIDTSALGLEQGEDSTYYFCTPKGARIIGWTGVDGIHFCFVRGFGEMVFSVSPMNSPGDYVHPVAASFSDFLSLLLACGDTAPLEQAHGWSREQYDEFVLENPITAEQGEVCKVISDKLMLQPMEDPYGYIKKLQEGFDISRIHFTEDYYEYVPEERKLSPWRVYFEGGFYDRSHSTRQGKEHQVGTWFEWDDKTWLIPAYYITAQGLVIDLCMKAEEKQVRTFAEKWDLSLTQQYTEDEKRMLMEADNPLSIDIISKVTVNGKELRQSRGYGITWNPFFPEQHQTQAEERQIVEHYQLDLNSGWAFERMCFPWKTKRRPKLNSITLELQKRPVNLPGPHFHAEKAGMEFRFTHPVSGLQHTLTVQEFESGELPDNSFRNDGMQYPRHYISMTYSVNPELSKDEIALCDCSRGDRPIRKPIQDTVDASGNPPKAATSASCAVSVAVIGGADGPTSVFIGGRQSKLHTAISALTFEAVDSVEWRMVFRDRSCADSGMISLSVE